MADSSALADSLDRAAEVFSLARTLGWEFQQDFKSRGAAVMAGDESPRDKHRAKIDEFIKAVLESSDAVKNPPDGFASVADQLRIAGRLAKQLKQNEVDILGLFPDLNTLAYEGYQTVKAVWNDTQPDDPFAVFDEPEVSESPTVIDATGITPTRDELKEKIQTTRDRIRHPNASHNPHRLAADAYNEYATIWRLCDKCGIKAPPLPDHRLHPLQTMNYVLQSLDDVELVCRRKGDETADSTCDSVADRVDRDGPGLEEMSDVRDCASKQSDASPKQVQSSEWFNEQALVANNKPNLNLDNQPPAPSMVATTFSDSVNPMPFDGGTMTFYEDRVELCGANICSGPRSQTRRRILKLLSTKREDGTLQAFSGDKLAAELKDDLERGSIAGAIKSLRVNITKVL